MVSRVKYYVIYKPFGMLPQFKDEAGRSTLANLPILFPKDVYPVGRLDKDSEGLLVLTNDKRLNNLLLNPDFNHKRTYWVQVEGVPTDKALEDLKKGVTIRIDKRDYRTKPAEAQQIEEPTLPERDPPIRFRKTVPDSWIELTLTEGKNRQVRRMTAAVNLPTLRLVRASIGNLTIKGMQPSDVIEMDRHVIYQQLGIMK